jgi:ribonuclease HI
VIERNGEVLCKDSGSVRNTTNNRMELTAVLEALRRAPSHRLEVLSDSTYVIKGINIWVPQWKIKRWRAGGKPVKNMGLWQELDEAVLAHPAPVRFRWVRGHVGGAFNEMADKMASEARLALA